MDNRINRLFERKKDNILSVFFTAGYPDLDDTKTIVDELSRQGIDMIEIGIPFSDPMADGPIIQKSSTTALENGITVKKILEQIKDIRGQVKDTPFIAMGYINPILQYGIDNFMRDAKEAGIDGLIIPDLPYEEYIASIRDLSRSLNLPVIMLITPETSDKRIHLIDDNCDGFIYMVSSASTTGTRDSFSSDQMKYFNRINSMGLKHPRLIGFGISNPKTLKSAFENASGAIVGSLFIKCLEVSDNIPVAVRLLLDTLGHKVNRPI